MPTFSSLLEPLCMLCVVLMPLAILRTQPPGRRARWLGDYLLLALAGWVGVQTSFTLHRHLEYESGWGLRLGDVPLLVPLVWPLVLLSARAVREALVPAAKGWQRPLLVWFLVSADASLLEALATRAELWAWREPGQLGVPLVGLVAWGHLGAAADVLLDRLEGSSRVLVVPASVLAAHALICASWWYGLRWLPRGDLDGVVVVAALGAFAFALAWRLRRAGRFLSRSTAAW